MDFGTLLHTAKKNEGVQKGVSVVITFKKSSTVQHLNFILEIQLNICNYYICFFFKYIGQILFDKI